MDQRIASLPHAPLPLDQDSYYEVLVPDISSDTGYTSCRIKPKDLTGVKRYKVLVNQTGTDDPTVTVLENTLGGTPVWSRFASGKNICTLAGAFPDGKTFVTIGSGISGGGNLHILGHNTIDDAPNSIGFNTYKGIGADGSTIDDCLWNTSILIEVYP